MQLLQQPAGGGRRAAARGRRGGPADGGARHFGSREGELGGRPITNRHGRKRGPYVPLNASWSSGTHIGLPDWASPFADRSSLLTTRAVAVFFTRTLAIFSQKKTYFSNSYCSAFFHAYCSTTYSCFFFFFCKTRSFVNTPSDRSLYQ